MVSRINVLAKGFSGISSDTLRGTIQFFNADCLPCVPVVSSQVAIRFSLGLARDLGSFRRSGSVSAFSVGLHGRRFVWLPF